MTPKDFIGGIRFRLAVVAFIKSSPATKVYSPKRRDDDMLFATQSDGKDPMLSRPVEVTNHGSN